MVEIIFKMADVPLSIYKLESHWRRRCKIIYLLDNTFIDHRATNI